MPNNDVFFVDQSEQSAVKAHIVSSYFSAWSRVIQKWNTPMAYIDLFCGPGKYENDKPSAPLLVVQNTLANPALLNRMNFVFNDKDPNNISMLKQAISQIDENSKLVLKTLMMLQRSLLKIAAILGWDLSNSQFLTDQFSL